MANISTTTPTTVGGFSIPWDVFRPLLPDNRWALYGAGYVVIGGPAVVATLAYQKDDGTLVTLGTQTFSTSGKAEMGPVPLRGAFADAAGIPREAIITVALQAQLAATGATASLTRWTLWLRMTPRNT